MRSSLKGGQALQAVAHAHLAVREDFVHGLRPLARQKTLHRPSRAGRCLGGHGPQLQERAGPSPILELPQDRLPGTDLPSQLGQQPAGHFMQGQALAVAIAQGQEQITQVRRRPFLGHAKHTTAQTHPCAPRGEAPDCLAIRQSGAPDQGTTFAQSDHIKKGSSS